MDQRGPYGKETEQAGMGSPESIQAVTCSLNGPQQNNVKVLLDPRGRSKQPEEFRDILTVKQLEGKNLKQLRCELEKPHLLFLFLLFPTSLPNLGGVRTQDWQDKAGVETPSQKKKFTDAPLPVFLASLLQLAELGSGQGRSFILNSVCSGVFIPWC